MKKKITIKDIALSLNIHHATVSRALRNDERISDKLRKTIQKYAHEHGYEVDAAARDFRNKESREIALIVPNISHFTFSYFISQFCALAQKQGLIVSVFQSQENVNIENEIIQSIIRKRVMGVVASISKMTQDCEVYGKLKQFGIPLVLFDRVLEELPVSKVVADNQAAGEQAISYMHSKGYRRIAHITGPQHINVFKDRHLGVLTAQTQYELDYRTTIVIEKEFELSDGDTAMQKLMSASVFPDAILCDSFVLSAGVTMYCQKMGISIPQDVALMSIANDPFSAIIQPPQTILEQPIEQMAQSAFELLIQHTSHPETTKPETVYLPVHLIERKSV